MSEQPPSDEKAIEVKFSQPGYAHTKLGGTCGPSVTVKDIMDKFYSPYFGGRDAWVNNGQWGVIRHDD